VPVSIINDAIGASRRAILDEIGEPPDLTLLDTPGNVGDQLTLAGTYALLADRIYTVINLEGLCRADGHTLLIRGGGGFCRPDHDLLPRALAVAELRFERVIVLPTSFDPGEDTVREALTRTRATVFACERESYRRIVSLCDARLAHDCSFFFDFAPYDREGSGVLDAFRTDREVLLDRSGRAGNDDISATAQRLDGWLEAIARHELIRTDRARVMIAGALLGKQVEFAPCRYHKVEAIASYSLADYPVRPIRAPAQAAPVTRTTPQTRAPAATRVTAVILTRDRPELAMAAIDSLDANETAAHTVLIDNNSGPIEAARLVEGCAARERVQLHRLDRNLGIAGGRQFGCGLARDEFVLFLDDDAELLPGALDVLVAELDAHPEAQAVTATVQLADGTVHHSGGWLQFAGEVAEFSLVGPGETSAALPPSGPVGWLPGTAALIRRPLLDEFPLDSRMTAPYYEDNEWSYRVELERPGSFRRSVEARAFHRLTLKLAPGASFADRSANIELLMAHAQFYERHGVLLGINLAELLPGLCDSTGSCDLAAARLLMELLAAKGTDWTLMEWMNGNLDVLVESGWRATAARVEGERLEQQAVQLDQQTRQLDDQARELDQQAAQLARQAEQVTEQDAAIRWLVSRHEAIEQGGWWRLRGRLQWMLRVWWRVRELLER
jgi:glycosyltransferase involved in cell wall biosynthesis